MPGELVTHGDFADFVRTEAYFESAHWWLGIFRGVEGGDEILERIGFDWFHQDKPTLAVTWFEASAYASWRNGRLPWADEIAAERRAKPRRGAWLGLWPPTARQEPPEMTFKEWCADWFNENVGAQVGLSGREAARRRAAAPGPGGLRVVYVDRPVPMLPSFRDTSVGFRVFRDAGRHGERPAFQRGKKS